MRTPECNSTCVAPPGDARVTVNASKPKRLPRGSLLFIRLKVSKRLLNACQFHLDLQAVRAAGCIHVPKNDGLIFVQENSVLQVSLTDYRSFQKRLRGIHGGLHNIAA